MLEVEHGKILWTLHSKVYKRVGSYSRSSRHGRQRRFVWFLCFLGGFVPLQYFSLIWKRHNYQQRAANFVLYFATLMGVATRIPSMGQMVLGKKILKCW